MGSILVGTASWSDTSLIRSGKFYPRDIKSAEDRLRFYATQFALTEVDSSYYGLPSEHNAALWVERTPKDRFTLDLKAFRVFTTHQTPPEAFPKDIREALGPAEKKNFYYQDLPEELRAELWRRFRAGIEPLRQADKLGAILFQFPPWFLRNRTNREHILHCAEQLQGYRMAVEFRNGTWFDDKYRDSVLAFEREQGLVHVIVDEPQGFASSIPPVWEVTCPELAIVRLHGHNRETWERKGLASSAERFAYLYSSDELKDLAGPVHDLAHNAKRVHVLFNNCYQDYATRNASAFRDLVSQSNQFAAQV